MKWLKTIFILWYWGEFLIKYKFILERENCWKPFAI